MAIRYHRDVEYGIISYPWPGARDAQVAMLRDLRGWERDPLIGDYLHDNDYEMTGAFTLDAGFGDRWFHVWMRPVDRNVIVIKQPPSSTFLVQCNLAVAGLQHIRAEFATLSGRIFASKFFSLRGVHRYEPLLLEDLEEVAAEQALAQDLVESEYQYIQFMIEGVRRVLPPGLLLWDRNTVDEAAFEAKLVQLRSLSDASEAELTDMNFYALGIPSSDGDSGTDLSDEESDEMD